MSVDPFSIAVVIYPSTITSAQQAIVAQVIYDTIASDRKSCGAVEYEITDTSGYTQTVRWTYATEQPVDVQVEVTLLPGYDLADVEDPVLEALAAYFADLTVGADARFVQVASAVAGVEGVLDAAITLDGGTTTIVANATVLLTLDPASAVTE